MAAVRGQEKENNKGWGSSSSGTEKYMDHVEKRHSHCHWLPQEANLAAREVAGKKGWYVRKRRGLCQGANLTSYAPELKGLIGGSRQRGFGGSSSRLALELVP